MSQQILETTAEIEIAIVTIKKMADWIDFLEQEINIAKADPPLCELDTEALSIGTEKLHAANLLGNSRLRLLQ